MSLLEVDAIDTYYGDAHTLFGVSLRVEQHEVVALLGRNGAGKTTALKTIMGVIAPRRGAIRFAGEPIQGLPPYKIARRGVQLVPDERRIIGGLTVEENLVLAGLTAPERWSLDRIYAMFPRLQERRRQRGRELSGGEQQMLAIARGIMSDPDILIIDELSLGLAPKVVYELFRTLKELKELGLTILLVEQNVHLAFAMSDHAYVIAEGRLFTEGDPAVLAEDPEIRRAYLGL
ncbi:MAG TPA: ABC transporter ATP-binding protein [Stellaceae bacterium]|nr:ABC transporter ATP-binding protein [Stellaceae bacterium]